MNKETLATLLRHICECLGNGFVPYGVCDGEIDRIVKGPFDSEGKFIGDYVLYFHNGKRNGTLEIRGGFPNDLWNHLSYDERQKTHSIHVSEDKGAAKIAIEIASRLLPEYVRMIKSARISKDRTEKRRVETMEKAEHLAHLLGSTLSEYRRSQDEVFFYNPHCPNVRVSLTFFMSSSDQVDMQNGWIPADLAEQIFPIIKQYIDNNQKGA